MSFLSWLIPGSVGPGDRLGCSSTARGTVWAFRSLLTAMNRSARAPPMLRASLVADTLPVGLDIVAAPNAPDWRWRNGKLWRLGILAITPPREPKHLTGKATSATSDGSHYLPLLNRRCSGSQRNSGCNVGSPPGKVSNE